nr:hypothetical protein CFP56_11320 [Quercus suber]
MEEDMSPPLKRRRLEDPAAVPGSHVQDGGPHFVHSVSTLPKHSLRPARIPSHVDEIHLRVESRAVSYDAYGRLHNRQLGTALSSTSSTSTVNPLTNVNSIAVSVAVSATVDSGSTTTSSSDISASETSSVSARLSSSSDASATIVKASTSSLPRSSASRSGSVTSSSADATASTITSSAANNGTSSATFAASGLNLTTSATTITSGSLTFTSATTLTLSSSTLAPDAAYVYLATLSDGSVQDITEYGHMYTTTFPDGQVSTISAASTTHRSTTTDARGGPVVFLLTASTEQRTMTSPAPVSAADAPTGVAGAGIQSTTTSSATSGTSSAASSGGSGDNSTPPAGTIAGGVVGGCAGLAALLLIAMLFLRWYRRRAQLGHQALPPNLAGPPGGLPDAEDPGGPRSAGMAERAGLVPLMGAIPAMLRPHPRDGQAAAPETGERGFQRVSGRKMPSAFSEGMQGPPPTMPLTTAGRDLNTTSFYRDSDGSYGGEGASFGEDGGVPIASQRSHDELTLSPGPRRTPTVHAAGPYHFSMPSRNVAYSPPGNVATYGSLDTPSPPDTNRNSRFTEEV